MAKHCEPARLRDWNHGCAWSNRLDGCYDRDAPLVLPHATERHLCKPTDTPPKVASHYRRKARVARLAAKLAARLVEKEAMETCLAG